MLKTSRTAQALMSQALSNSAGITRATRYTALAVAGMMATTGSAWAVDANTLPVGGNVASGSADINYHANQPQLDINQHSDRVIIDWSQFNIGQNATTQFNQNGAHAIAVNRVHDVNPSQILGSLRANGQVVVLNTNGVVFGNGAQVDVSGLLVSTGELDAQLFQSSGQIALSNINANPNAKVENRGHVAIQNSGLAAFVAPQVSNSGIIEARLGKIALASGTDKATVDLYGDGLVELVLDDNAGKAVIDNTGTLKADGGTIAMTASAAKNVVDSVINMGGIVEANSVGVKNGVITLGASNTNVKVTGKVHAKGGNGQIDVRSDENIHVADTAEIDASAYENGNGGIIHMIADKHMDFRGSLFARGGSQSGNGGFAEISGYEILGYTGYANLGATNGTLGDLLLDPAFAVIHSGGLDQPLGLGYVLSAQALANSMESSNVTVQADNFIDVGTKQGGYNTGNAFVDAVLNGILGHGDIDLSTYDYNRLEVVGTVPFFGWPIYGLVNYTGTTQGTLQLQADTVNFNRDMTLGDGSLDVDANTVNLNALLRHASGLLDQARIASNAAIVNVLSNAAKIQQGIFLGDVGSTINVASGTYDESVDISKSVTMKGANAGTAGDDVRVAETTIRATDWYGISVEADDVTVDGFTVDGSNNGISNDYMIVGYNADNAHITNNIITGANFGVFLYGTGATNSLIDNNKLFNIHGLNGQAIHIRDNAYADILNNVISDADVGITTENFRLANSTGVASTISGNTISAGKIGIRNNLSTGSQTGFVFSDNTITAENPADTRRWTGIDVISQNGGVASIFMNNIIDGSGAGARQSAGYELTNMLNSNRAVIDGGNVSNVGVGIWATDGSFYTGAVNDLLIQNVAFNDIGETAILVEDTEAVVGNINDTVNATASKITIGLGNTFTNTPYDLTIAGDNITIALDAGFDGVRSTFVKAGGPARYSASGLTTNNASINTGIGATAAGGTVTVDDGTFVENVVLNKGLTLRSLNGRDNTTIEGIANVGALGTQTSNLVFTNNDVKGDAGLNYVATLHSDGGLIDGNTFTASTNGGTSLRVRGNDMTVTNNTFTAQQNTQNGIELDNVNTATVGGSPAATKGNSFNGGAIGIIVNGGSKISLVNNTIENASVLGIYANGINGANLNNPGISIISNNITDSQKGIYVFNSSFTKIWHNVLENIVSTAIQTAYSSNANIRFNLVRNTTGNGIVVDLGSSSEISNNQVYKITGNGIDVRNSADVNILNNVIGAKASTLVAQGIDNVKGDGIYASNANGVVITGNHVTETHSTGTDNGSGIQVVNSNDIVIGGAGTLGNTVLNAGWDGIRITNVNNATIDNNIVDTVARVGIYGGNLTNSVFQNNIVKGSYLAGYGAISTDFGSDLSFINNTISDSHHGIRTYLVNGANLYDGNIISDVTETGIYIENGNEHTVIRNDITGGKTGIHLTNVNKGVVGGSDTNGNTIRDTQSGWANAGIRINRGLDITVSHKTLRNIGGQSIYAENYWNSPVTPLTISNNVIRDAEHNGIQIAHWNGAQITENRINGVAVGNGIQLSLTRNSTVSDNVIKNVKAAGIHLRYNNHDTTISDNRISEARNGIHVATTGGQHNTNTFIENNRIFDVTTGIRADYGSNLTILDNILRDIHNEGIRTDQINTVLIDGNTLRNVSWSGVQVEGGKDVTVINNTMNDIRGNGVQVSGTNVAEVLRNTIRNIRLSGIVVNGVRSTSRINGNTIVNTGAHGISVDNNQTLRIRNNTIRNVGQNGINIKNSGPALVAGNFIRNADTGIMVNATGTTPRPSVVIRENIVRNASVAGVHIAGTGHSTVTLRDNVFNSTLDGAIFESSEIKLRGKNIIRFTRDGMVFDGNLVSLANDSFGRTVLTDTDNVDNSNSFFIRLTNGALFAPGTPTILDATRVKFTDDIFTKFVPNSFVLPFSTYLALENRLFDFDDDNTLGQIFFTFPGGADFNDVLPQQFLANIPFGPAGSVTILNVPSNTNTVPNFGNLANIAPAAGGEPNTSGDPDALNNIETAAGSGVQAECWSQVYSSLSGSATAVTYSLDGSPASLLSAQASCGGQGI